MHELSIFDTFFTIGDDINYNTAVDIWRSESLRVFIKNCIINFFGKESTANGIAVRANENSQMELNINQCSFLALNYKPFFPYSGYHPYIRGIFLNSPENSFNLISITASTFIGSTVYVWVRGPVATLFPVLTTMTLFNCTMRGGEQHSPGIEIDMYIGERVSKCMILNVTQNHIEGTSVGINIRGGRHQYDNLTSPCTLEAHLSDTLFTHNEGAAVQFFTSSGIVSITETIFEENYSGSIIILQGASITINIVCSAFLQNIDGIIIHSTSSKDVDIPIDIANTTFYRNKGVSLGVKKLQTEQTKVSDLTLSNVTLILT